MALLLASKGYSVSEAENAVASAKAIRDAI